MKKSHFVLCLHIKMLFYCNVLVILDQSEHGNNLETSDRDPNHHKCPIEQIISQF